MEKVDWVAEHLIPHEAALRQWLHKVVAWQEVEDIVQEAFCDIASLDGFGHIIDPKRYLFRVARNLVIENLRRAQVVRIDAIGGAREIELAMEDDYDSITPERIAADRAWLSRIDALIATLPARARAVFHLRKFEGLSQRDVSHRLGVSEAVVENDLTRGLRSILNGLSEEEREELSVYTKERRHVRPRKR